jgi:hypothetical protein
MKEYELSRVKKDGKEHSNCALAIDEEKGYAQIKYKRGLRRELFQLVDFYYDASTVIDLEGERLRVGELEMVAKSRGEAGTIAESIRKPAAELRKQAESALAEAEAAAQGFLVAREAAILTLMKLKKDPRGTLLDVSASWKDLTGDPVDQLYSSFQENLLTSKEKMDAEIEAIRWKVGTKAVERLYAFCYAVGKLQDAIFSGSAENAEEVKKSLVELGIRGADIKDVPLEGSSQRIVRLATPVLFLMIELPAQAAERSALLGPPKKA